MKITSDNVFNHPWETVVTAVWRKYPNPHNPAVVGVDVVDRVLHTCGVLHSHRLLITSWGLPKWASRLLGMDQMCYASEHSEVDPKNKRLTMFSRNITFFSTLMIEEQLVYVPHPEDKKKTIYHQSTFVTVSGLPFRSKLESILIDYIAKTSGKGRLGMECVIEGIKKDAQEFSTEALKLSCEAKKLSEEAKKHWDIVLASDQPNGSTVL